MNVLPTEKNGRYVLFLFTLGIKAAAIDFGRRSKEFVVVHSQNYKTLESHSVD